jgi:outer membrane protein OmpA-like peptidoglycan-associated protein/tetratricopeptide (TPR) repeat protein
MKYFFALISSFLILGSTIAQDKPEEVKEPINVKRDFNKAKELWLYEYNYIKALEILQKLIEAQPDNAYWQFIIGDCYLHHPTSKSSALTYLQKAENNVSSDMANFDFEDHKTSQAPVTVYKLLGIAYRLNYKFDESLAAFETYKNQLGSLMTEEEKKEIEREIKMTKTGKNLVKYPVDLEINTVSSVVNSKFPEYAPVVSADEKTLIFTSRRGGEGDALDPIDFGYYEDIYISEKKDGNWSAPKKISDKINTSGHEATIGLSVDGQQLLIYSTKDDPNGNIYYSKLEGDQWTAPVAFEALNSNASEEHACFNADGSVIYFTSNRKGGYGGYDVYKVKKLPNGEWSLPQNLGPKINTEFDERAPFIHPDGVSLFFSSTGHETMGGYDIFQAYNNPEDGSWSTPENIGYPINTTDDDVFYVTSVDGKRAYYSSLRPDGMGEKDLYMITIKKEQEKEKALTVMSGVFTLGDKEGNVPADARIIVTDNETGEIVGIYKPNSKTGKYLFILPPGKNYNVTYEAQNYLFKSENLIVPKNSTFSNVKKEIKLAPIKANQSIVLNNVFFEFDSDKLTADSKVELDKLYNLLTNNPSIRVEISGHTDSKGRDQYNLELSQKRAESVKKFLVQKGIKADRIVAKGYGETRPIARNQNADGTDNPEGRQLNRRIELKVLNENGEEDKKTVNQIYVPDELKK